MNCVFQIMVVSMVNFRVLAHDRTLPGSVLALCEKAAGGGVGGLAVVCGESASPTLRHYSLPGLKIASEESLPGGGPVGRHVKLQVILEIVVEMDQRNQNPIGTWMLINVAICRIGDFKVE